MVVVVVEVEVEVEVEVGGKAWWWKMYGDAESRWCASLCVRWRLLAVADARVTLPVAGAGLGMWLSTRG